MSDNKIIFSMVNVSKTYPPQKQVLKNIYLSFFYGAKIGIIGLNGSGKSTLLKIIAGLEKSFQGDVVFSPGYSVGYLSQEPELDESKTVKEIVREEVGGIFPDFGGFPHDIGGFFEFTTQVSVIAMRIVTARKCHRMLPYDFQNRSMLKSCALWILRT